MLLLLTTIAISVVAIGLFIYTEIDQRRFEREFNDKKDNHG